MINGPMIGGFLIALVLIGSALFAGSWFSSAIQFADAHSLDAARTTKPVVCTFSTEEFGGKTTGTIHSRDGLMRFDIHDVRDGAISDWGVEVDMNGGNRMMSRANLGDPYMRLDEYPDLRVQMLEDLKKIIQTDTLHCAPWWSAASFRFNLQAAA